MFEYIQKKIREQESSAGLSSTPIVSDMEDSAILEYAHLFQELDDLSIGGEDEHRTRPLEVDIPLENDLEIETVEFNMMDGRLTDIPADATVQEEYEVTDRSKMKTYQHFYQEAMSYTQRMPRENNDAYSDRVAEIAQKEYNQYCNYLIQEGLFGFNKIDLNDNRVPANAMCNFGPIKEGGKDYMVKLPVKFETDRKHKITKQQLDAISMFQSLEATSYVGEPLTNLLKKDFASDMEKVQNVWDVATPTCLYVMGDQADKYKVTIEFELDFDDKPYYMTWSHSIKSERKKAKAEDLSFMQHQIMSKKTFKSKKEYVKESYEMGRPTRQLGDYEFYQEEIDFGAGDTNSEVPPAMDTGNPSVSMDNSNPNPDQNAAQTDGSTSNNASDPINPNDVSDQIVEKIQDNMSAESNENGDVGGDDISTDGDVGVDSEGDTSGDVTDSDVSAELDSLDDSSTSDDMSVDDQLNDLDGDGGLDDSSVDGSIDINNMTIDELLEQGSDKLKGMTVQQLKDFLSGDPSAIQEAFILTKKNINGELEVHLRTALGILNDDQMNVDELLGKFKVEGKKLNHVLSKAAKMKKVYSDEECGSLNRLNKCLTDLTMIIKSSKDANYAATIKRLIQAFTSEAAAVSKIIESKKGDKPVAEGYVDGSDSDDEIFQETLVITWTLGQLLFSVAFIVGVASRVIPIYYKKYKIRHSYVDIYKYTTAVLEDIKNEAKVERMKKNLEKLKKAIENAIKSPSTTSDEAKTLKDFGRCVSDILAVFTKLKASKKNPRKIPEQLDTYLERFMLLSVEVMKIMTGDFDEEMADKVLADVNKIKKEGKVNNDAE